jgi:hypothetical protein
VSSNAVRPQTLIIRAAAGPVTSAPSRRGPHVRGHRLDIPTQAQARRRELCIVEVVDQTRELTSLVCDRGENEMIIGTDHSYSSLAEVQI